MANPITDVLNVAISSRFHPDLTLSSQVLQCYIPGAPHASRVCSLKSFWSRFALAAVVPAVGARKYMREKFTILPTCQGATSHLTNGSLLKAFLGC